MLFLCIGNCCRSPMAEALFRDLAGGRYESLSAGSCPAGFVHPSTREVLTELGIDTSGQRSKHILEFLPPRGKPPDLLVSLCGSAAEECPPVPAGVARAHWPFEDPISARGTEEEVLAVFRRLRDRMRERISRAIAGGEIDRLLGASPEA